MSLHQNIPVPRRSLVVLLVVLPLSAGCMAPGMYTGMPYAPYNGGVYGQPMYAPPQSLNQTAPGTLVIPESNQQYEPGRTYDNDPVDDFNRPSNNSGNGQFYQPGNDGVVPQPRDPNSGGSPFEEDLGGPSTQFRPSGEIPAGESGIRQVSATAANSDTGVLSASGMSPEYGFDTVDYRWLRGVAQPDSATGQWMITYSLAAHDRFRGMLPLSLSAEQARQLIPGAPVDVQGRIEQDAGGSPVYRVESIQSIHAPGM
ncbi:MAG: hypothetical protein KDA89_12160 [Planctomycetaceae bacterium]|nr:hypothetical protein [Planctomycetaceae bacterium]